MRKELALLAAAAPLFTFLAFSAQARLVASLKGGAKSVDQVTRWPEVTAEVGTEARTDIAGVTNLGF